VWEAAKQQSIGDQTTQFCKQFDRCVSTFATTVITSIKVACVMIGLHFFFLQKNRKINSLAKRDNQVVIFFFKCMHNITPAFGSNA